MIIITCKDKRNEYIPDINTQYTKCEINLQRSARAPATIDDVIDANREWKKIFRYNINSSG